jgi:dephospho-CoA kinase
LIGRNNQIPEPKHNYFAHMRKINKYLNPKIIGVTGGIGSGQSTVCKYLQDAGCKIIDVDKKAKQVIKRDATLRKQLSKEFGSHIFDNSGDLNRRKLAEIAFGNAAKTLLLNRLVHPRMVSDLIEEMERARFSSRYPLVVVDAALIYEISIEKMFDCIIVVYADLRRRIQRVRQRDGLTKEEIMARVGRQIPLAEKKAWADYVINNNADFVKLKAQTLEIFKELVRDVETTKAIRV